MCSLRSEGAGARWEVRLWPGEHQGATEAGPVHTGSVGVGGGALGIVHVRRGRRGKRALHQRRHGPRRRARGETQHLAFLLFSFIISFSIKLLIE